jgi:hypothetical protein
MRLHPLPLGELAPDRQDARMIMAVIEYAHPAGEIQDALSFTRVQPRPLGLLDELFPEAEGSCQGYLASAHVIPVQGLHCFARELLALFDADQMMIHNYLQQWRRLPWLTASVIVGMSSCTLPGNCWTPTG